MLLGNIRVPSLVTAIVFLNVGPIYRFLQRLVWRLTGVQTDRARAGRCYERSVHVQRVLWRRRVSTWLLSDESNFLTLHERFDHPTILKDPSVSLFGLTASEAIFIKPHEGTDVYSSETHPFLKWAQADNAEMVYTIPHASFHRLAAEVGDPRLPVIWLSNIGRCGSTLLLQAFEKIPGTVSLGEPDALLSLSVLSKSETVSTEEARALLKSLIRLQCKNLPGAQRIIMKVTALTFAEVKDIHTMFPNIRHMFMFRESLPYAKSAKALTRSELMSSIIRRLIDSDIYCKLFPDLRMYMYRNCVRIDRDDHDLEGIATTLTFIGHWFVLSVAIMNRYKEFVEDNLPIFAIKYEDLVNHKEDMLEKVFQKLCIPEKYVPLALTAFETDSQRGSNLSKTSTGARVPLTSRELSDANKVLAKYGFPPCDELIYLPRCIVPGLTSTKRS